MTRISVSLTISGGVSERGAISLSQFIHRAGTIVRTVFDGPDSATYSWAVYDSKGEPINARTTQVGDTVISEEYPVDDGATIQIQDSDTDGVMEVVFWVKP